MTNFPTSLQDLDPTRGTSGQTLATPNHITHHKLEDDTLEALQAKVGADNSAVQTSHDYKLGEVTGADKSVGKSAAQDLTNKNLGTGTKVTLGSDVTGDLYYRHSDGTLKRLGVSTDGKFLSTVSGLPAWTSGGLLTSDQGDALAGQSGTLPSASNKLIDAADVSSAAASGKIVRANGTALPALNGASLTGIAPIPIYKNGTTTHDVSVTGTQTIAHGLGKVPNYIKINTLYGSTNAFSNLSIGTYNGTTTATILYGQFQNSSPEGTIFTDSTNILNILISNYSGANRWVKATATIDGTNITLTWTNSSSPTGIAVLMWEAFA